MQSNVVFTVYEILDIRNSRYIMPVDEKMKKTCSNSSFDAFCLAFPSINLRQRFGPNAYFVVTLILIFSKGLSIGHMLNC